MSGSKSCENCDSQTCSARKPQDDESPEQFLERQELAARLCQIHHKILILSGKGGVGKSTVAANLAVTLALGGERTGLLDIDLHGPSIPKLLHLEGRPLASDGQEIEPAAFGELLKVVSIGFLLQHPDDAVIWRGPLKMGVIKQFLKDVHWGELDYLVVDSPPGTGDEPRKCISFCRQLHTPVLGVVENMSGFVCPHCGERTDLFGAGGGEQMAGEMGVPFLGRIPIDPAVVASGDEGRPFVPIDPAVVASGDEGRPFVHHQADGPAAAAFATVTDALRQRLGEDNGHGR